jgi:hypothetical protein
MKPKFEPIVGRYMHLDLFGTASMSRRRAQARRYCACTPPAATGGNTAR